MKDNTVLELVHAVLNLDWSSDNNKELKQLMSEGDVDNFDCDFKNQLCMMIESLTENDTIKQGDAEAANFDVVALLLAINFFTNQVKAGKLTGRS